MCCTYKHFWGTVKMFLGYTLLWSLVTFFQLKHLHLQHWHKPDLWESGNAKEGLEFDSTIHQNNPNLFLNVLVQTAAQQLPSSRCVFCVWTSQTDGSHWASGLFASQSALPEYSYVWWHHLHSLCTLCEGVRHGEDNPRTAQAFLLNFCHLCLVSPWLFT